MNISTRVSKTLKSCQALINREIRWLTSLLTSCMVSWNELKTLLSWDPFHVHLNIQLTHCGLAMPWSVVKHFRLGKRISSSHYLNQCLIVHSTIANGLRWNLNQKTILIETAPELLSAKQWLFSLDLNMLSIFLLFQCSLVTSYSLVDRGKQWIRLVNTLWPKASEI